MRKRRVVGTIYGMKYSEHQFHQFQSKWFRTVGSTEKARSKTSYVYNKQSGEHPRRPTPVLPPSIWPDVEDNNTFDWRAGWNQDPATDVTQCLSNSSQLHSLCERGAGTTVCLSSKTCLENWFPLCTLFHSAPLSVSVSLCLSEELHKEAYTQCAERCSKLTTFCFSFVF